MAVNAQRIPVADGLPYRLGRHIETDTRTRTVRRAPAGKDQLWTFSKPVLNQLSFSSCVGNAVMQCFNTDYFAPLRVAKGVEWFTEGDALQCYHLATIADNINGENDVFPPTDDGTTALAGGKAAVQMGLASAYHCTVDFPSFCAAIEQQPICVGTDWTNSMFSPAPDGLVTVDFSEVVGGHEYVCLGVSYTLQRLRFLTSWGPDFGVHGQFEVGFADFQNLLANQGDVLVLHGVGMPFPDPANHS